MNYRTETLKQQEKLRPGEENTLRMFEDLTSPYSAKVRTYFHYKQIPYRSMRTTLDIYTGRIVDLVGAPIIPVVLLPDDRVLQDSTPILQYFEAEKKNPPALTTDQALNLLLWIIEDFADEYMVRFAIHFRWGNEQNRRVLAHRIARRFAYGIDGVDFDVAAERILKRQSKFNNILGLDTPEVRDDIAAQSADIFALLNRHFEKHSFLFGERPSVADFSLFGPIWAHTFNDPGSTELLETKAPYLVHWLEMIDDLGDPRGARGRTEFGDFFLLENLPQTLIEILAWIAETWLPLMRAAAEASQKDLTVYTATIRGIEAKFKFPHYKAWAFEQVQLMYQNLQPVDAERCAAILSQTKLLPGLTDQGIMHNGLFDGFTPPVITRGAMDQRTLAMKELLKRRSRQSVRPD